MKIFDKIMGAMGMLEYEDDYPVREPKYAEDRDEHAGFGFGGLQAPVAEESNIKTFGLPSNSNKILNIHNNAQMKMVVVCPQSYEEAREVCDYVKARKPVVVNLESMDHIIAQRVMDFLSGSCYSLNGDIKRVTKNIFVLAPDNVDISSEVTGQYAMDKQPSTLPWMKTTK